MVKYNILLQGWCREYEREDYDRLIDVGKRRVFKFVSGIVSPTENLQVGPLTLTTKNNNHRPEPTDPRNFNAPSIDHLVAGNGVLFWEIIIPEQGFVLQPFPSSAIIPYIDAVHITDVEGKVTSFFEEEMLRKARRLKVGLGDLEARARAVYTSDKVLQYLENERDDAPIVIPFQPSSSSHRKLLPGQDS